MRGDGAFKKYVVDCLAGLAGVQAVCLGGSRALGTSRPESDWDFAVYCRAGFTPDRLRALGWSGQVVEIGGWGGGIPTYIVVAELAMNQVLAGELERPGYPEAHAILAGLTPDPARLTRAVDEAEAVFTSSLAAGPLTLAAPACGPDSAGAG